MTKLVGHRPLHHNAPSTSPSPVHPALTGHTSLTLKTTL